MNSLILISPSKGEAFNQFFLVQILSAIGKYLTPPKTDTNPNSCRGEIQNSGPSSKSQIHLWNTSQI
ncbi:hypothetical protein QUA86_14305 [Microcoleus sp. F6_B6]